VNKKNLLIFFTLTFAIIASFFWGGYHTLMPVRFILGLVFASAVYLRSSLYMETRKLVTLTMVSIFISLIDEFVHTSSGIFSYYDGMTPSPLTVFGWGILVLNIIAIAQFIFRRAPLVNLDSRILRGFLVMISIFLLIVSVMTQGYLNFFDSLLIFVYAFLSLASLYYSYTHQFGWNMWVMITSLIISTLMEFIGGVEGLWVYHFNEPMPIFIIFTWTLRIFTILAFSSFLGVEIQEKTWISSQTK
jgi:hypothetical protein